jgi:hypothetical protein
MSERAASAAVKLLRDQLPGVRFEIGLDNRWLARNFSKYANS